MPPGRQTETRTIRIISQVEGSEDIKKLQEVLKYEKFFPSNQECTGSFFAITARALIKWQLAHGLNDFANETDFRRVQAGVKTLAIINDLYK